MTRFRPCIDLHAGAVKQIVGSTLSSDPSTASSSSSLKTNYISPHPPSHFSTLYRDAHLIGAHVIMLGSGPDNVAAAREACSAWPNALQVGGGINEGNARRWIEEWGAAKVILTSYLFPDGRFAKSRLEAIGAALNWEGEKEKSRERLVIDLSCRRREGMGERWWVATEKWQRITDMELSTETFAMLRPFCSEFLIHAADQEGLCGGIDEALVVKLADWIGDGEDSVPVTYAGGAKGLADLDLVKRLSGGRVDLTIGSALDVFGGSGVTLEECIRWNREEEAR